MIINFTGFLTLHVVVVSFKRGKISIMNSTITITPIDNIKDFAVVNNDLVIRKTFDSDMAVLLMENKNGKRRMSNLMGVSLYDDLVIIEDIKYKVLHMLSK